MANTDRKWYGRFQLLVDRLREIADATRYKTGDEKLLMLQQIDDEVMSIEETGESYDGPTVVTPKFEEVILDTSDKSLGSDITVKPIEVTTVINVGGGNTLII